MSWFKIFSAVLVANIVSWIIVTILGWFIFFVVLDSFNEALGSRLAAKPDIQFPKISALSVPAQQLRKNSTVSPTDFLAEQARQEKQRLEQQRQQARNRADPSVIRTNKQMCEFWTAEFRKDGVAQSRKYRDAACKRYRESLN